MNNSLDVRTGNWTLHVVPPNFPKHLLISTANFAKHSPLIVLDCGRQFDASIVARAAHGRKDITDEIKIRRAFICSEVARLIRKTPAGKTPIFILDLLSTFCDENVKMSTRNFLLANTLFHLKRLSHGAGLAISVQLLDASDKSFFMFQRLSAAAPRVVQYEVPPLNDQSKQSRMF